MSPPGLHSQGFGRTSFHIQQIIDIKIRSYSPDNIRTMREQFPVEPECFADESLNSITPYCISNLAGYTDTQPAVLKIVRQNDKCEPIPPVACASLVNSLKLSCDSEQVSLRKSITTQKNYAVNCLRPLARLLLTTACPERVFIRTRKPWVRARLILLG